MVEFAAGQELDLDILPGQLQPSRPAPDKQIEAERITPSAPAAYAPDKPLSVTVTKTLYLPPAMYGQWSITGTLMEANAADLFAPMVRDIWILDRDGDTVFVENPANGARAAVNVDSVQGNTASFHRVVKTGRNKFYYENPTITVQGDTLLGHSVNRYREVKQGQTGKEYYAVYRLEAQRINGGRVQFKPQETMGGPDIEIEDVRKAR